MKHIVDIKNDTPVSVIDAWISENNYNIIHTFNHFEKMYVIESDGPITPTDFTETVVIDDHSSAIKLHSSTNTDIFTVSTDADDDWWKAVVIDNAIPDDGGAVNIIRRGSGYSVYLMDSGVNDAHEDFSNTTVRHLFSHTNTTTDLNGHGTALASIIAGSRAGITSAEIVSVKVFENGVPTLVSDIMKGLDAIAVDYLDKNLGKPAIINMSWSIDRNTFVEDKIRSLTRLGLLPIVAAGNSGVPIQNVTPAAMAEVGTVGSVDPNLIPSDFSNYTGPNDISFTPGETNYSPGLDFWAPGEYILAAARDGGFTYMAGTSAAAAVAAAVLTYHFGKIALEYGKVYHKSLMGFSNQFDEDMDIVATIDSLTNDLLVHRGHNPFIPSRILVDLSEKYVNCTNRIPFSFGLYDETFNNSAQWYIDVMYVKKGIPLNKIIYDPAQVDSASIAELPIGLTLNTNTGSVSGLLDMEMGEDKFKVFNTKLILNRGDNTLEEPFQIIYLDPAVLTEEFTVEDYGKLLVDSNMILQSGTCWNCSSYVACLGIYNSCQPCTMCPDGKTEEEYCTSQSNPC